MRQLLPIPFLLLPLVACLGTGGGGGVEDAEIITCDPEGDEVYADLGDGVDYVFEDDCRYWSLLGVNVVLEPGVTIQMNDGQYISVSYDGSLNAVGTAELPIVFQGSSETPSWQGIQVYSANQDNVFDYVTVSGAGAGVMIYLDEPSAVASWGEGYLKVSNLSIEHSGGDGLSILANYEQFPGVYGPGLSFTDIAGHPVRLNADHMETLDWAGFEDSELGEPTIAAFTNRLEKEATWANLPLPVLMETDLPVWADFRVEAGTELRFRAGNSLIVYAAGANPSAAFIGTEEAPIVLRGRLDQPGAWGGVFVGTSSPANRMEHVRIENGGGVEHTNEPVKANLTVGFYTAYLSLQDVEIADSADAGIVLDDYIADSVTLLTENVTYSGNAGGDLVDQRDD
ncbi:MAG: hypothetical protein ACI9VR_004214 [Cognaticolwellia sp.]|jgi:hypothetical protein